MTNATEVAADVEAILTKRHANGADHWAGPEGKVYVGNPFSTIAALGMLHELGVPADHEAVAGGLDLLLAACQEDGRIRVGPKSPTYPCYTAEAARMLCRYGLTDHEAVQRTVDHLYATVHEDGGWRCNFSKFGKGPETRCSNPGATLYALDVLSFYEPAGHDEAAAVDAAVDRLLRHWDTRKPEGPCHWGIGSQFMQVEYPFLRYNLFYWVYVLSSFGAARDDPRFRAALDALAEKTDDDGRMVVEKRHRNLGGLHFCARGEPSDAATARWEEILANVA